MAVAAPNSHAFLAGVPLAIGLAWIVALAVAAEVGAIAYAVPALAAAAFVTAFLVLKAMQGRPYAIAFLLVFNFFALNLNFRTRELGDIGLDWQNGIKLATWLVLVTVAVFRWRSIAPLLREPALALAFVYGMIALASAGWSEVPAYTGANAVGFFAYFGLSCMLVVDLGEDATIRFMLWTLLAYITMGMIGGVVAPDIAWQPPSVEETASRLQGFSSNPNNFDDLAGLFMTLTVIARRKVLVGRGVFWGMLLLGVTTIMASGGRATFIAVLTSSGLVAARNSRFGPAIVFAAAGALAVALALAACDALPNIDRLFAEVSRTGQESEILTLTGRTEIWEVVWAKIKEKPLFGWGFNGTEGLISSSFDKSFAGSPVDAHNAYLQAIISVGFVGSLPVFAYIFLLIGRFVTRPDPTRDQIFVLVAVLGITEAVYFTTPNVLTLVMIWALAREAAKRHPVADPAFEPVVEGAAHSLAAPHNGEPRRS